MKICVTGCQNVGKSTFLQDIIEAFPEFSTSEYSYRNAITAAKIEDSINRNTNIRSQKIIFDALADEIIRSKDFTIFDRSVLDAVAYTTWPIEYGTNPTDITPHAVQNMRNKANDLMEIYDLIIYIPLDESIKFEQDNLRDTDAEYRRQMGAIFDDLLILDIDDPLFDKYGYKVVQISGSRENRVQDFSEMIKYVK